MCYCRSNNMMREFASYCGVVTSWYCIHFSLRSEAIPVHPCTPNLGTREAEYHSRAEYERSKRKESPVPGLQLIIHSIFIFG